MKNFDYCTPTRLIFGKDSIKNLPDGFAVYGKRVLLTYGGGSIKKIGLYDKVKELLKDFTVTELSGIEPNPKYSTSVLDGVKLCKENNIDVVLAVGGGSVLDCSKAICAGAKYDGEPWELITYKVETKAALPLLISSLLRQRVRNTIREQLSRAQKPTIRWAILTNIFSPRFRFLTPNTRFRFQKNRLRRARQTQSIILWSSISAPNTQF